ncbi:MAG TPA: transcription factor S [Candidatus Hodarchaeales archaeon]|nr:transcription factor S [Candidatus Hodarchaeales archaeon]
MVQFCPKCKNMLIPVKLADGTIVLKCRKDDFTEGGKEIKLTQKINASEKQAAIVIDDPTRDASIEAECPHCRQVSKVAQWQVQTRSADEASTTFYRCSSCGQTWRDYGG